VSCLLVFVVLWAPIGPKGRGRSNRQPCRKVPAPRARARDANGAPRLAGKERVLSSRQGAGHRVSAPATTAPASNTRSPARAPGTTPPHPRSTGSAPQSFSDKHLTSRRKGLDPASLTTSGRPYGTGRSARSRAANLPFGDPLRFGVLREPRLVPPSVLTSCSDRCPRAPGCCRAKVRQAWRCPLMDCRPDNLRLRPTCQHRAGPRTCALTRQRHALRSRAEAGPLGDHHAARAGRRGAATRGHRRAAAKRGQHQGPCRRARQPHHTPGPVSGADLALRSFAAFPAQTSPPPASLTVITRRHIEDFKPWLAAEAEPGRKG